MYNTVVINKYAGVAQSVVQLIRNQQVACSSHVTSTKKRRAYEEARRFLLVTASLFTRITDSY